MNGTTPARPRATSLEPVWPGREDAFTAYRTHLSRVVAEALDRGADPEARWAIISQRMATWSRQVTALVQDLQESLHHTREQARTREMSKERER